jgi:hypothetical protein
VQLVKTPSPSTDWAKASAEAFDTALWPKSKAPHFPADGLYRRAAQSPLGARSSFGYS